MEQFLGQIIMVGFNFAPRGWAFCDGRLLPIAQNAALFSLLGTTYGGDGRTTFALPDLRGRAAIGMGQGPGLSQRAQGEMSGAENVTLLHTQMPAHTHSLMASTADGTTNAPVEAVIAVNKVPVDRSNVVNGNAFVQSSPNTVMNSQSIGAAGGNQPHNNMQPYLAVNYLIALEGIYPSRE